MPEPTVPADTPRIEGIVLRGPGGEALARATLGADWITEPLGPGLDGVFARTPDGARWGDAWRAYGRAVQASGDDIAYVEPAVSAAPGWADARPRGSSSGPGFGWDAPLEQIDAEAAWHLAPPGDGRSRGEGVLIAHPDTGYTHHPEVWGGPSGNRVRSDLGYDFMRDAEHAYDRPGGHHPGHGTSTASVMIGDGHIGPDGYDRVVRGSAPAAAVIPYRVTDTVVMGPTRIARAISRGIADGAGVVSISLGSPLPSRLLTEALDAAERKGVIVVAAAGQYSGLVPYPGRCPTVVTATATLADESLWGWAATGESIDIAAPGVGIQTARCVLETETWSVGPSEGTSYATALTAGAAACWLAHWDPAWLTARFGASAIPAIFRRALASNARMPVGWARAEGGHGILDMARLLALDLRRVEPRSAGPVATTQPPPVLDEAMRRGIEVRASDPDQRAQALLFAAASPPGRYGSVIELLEAVDHTRKSSVP